MHRSSVSIFGCLLLLVGSVAPSRAPLVLRLAQAGGIKGQDPETADRGQGNSGWVQAPVPRGHNAPEQTAQGAGASPAGQSGVAKTAPQPAPGQNPGTPVTTVLPGPSGATPASPAK